MLYYYFTAICIRSRNGINTVPPTCKFVHLLLGCSVAENTAQQEAGSTNGGEAEGEHGDEHNEFEDAEEEGEHEEAVEDEGGAVRKHCSRQNTQHFSQ